MKVLVALCILSIVVLTYGSPLTGGCQFGPWGRCYKQCEEGTSSYSTGCGPLTPEATCVEPNPVPGEAAICDYSACYCDAPTVRDTESGKCVKLEDCPPKKDQEDNKE